MAQDTTCPDRQQVFYADAYTIAAGQTLPEVAEFGAGAAGAYVINRASGMGHLKGVISGTTAPAAGFPRIRFWSAPGDATALTAIYNTGALTVDPNNAFTYIINEPMLTPFFTIEWTQGAAGGTISGAAWVYPYVQGGGSGASGGTIYVKDAQLTPLGYFQGSVDGTTAETLAVLTGSAIPAGALYAAIQVDTGGTNVFCRYRDDGTAPTAAVGMPLLPGVYFFDTAALANFQIIGSAAGPTTVNVAYYR